MQDWGKLFSRVNWRNKPNQTTPLSEANLNKSDYAIDEMDNRIITLDTVKLDLSVANGMVKSFTLDSSTGIITVTLLNGTVTKYDTKLDKIAVNFEYDADTQQLVITLDDGTKQYIDMSALITQYEFTDSSTIGFKVADDGKVSAEIIDGSITSDMLDTDYLGDITVQAQNASKSASSASESAADANYDAKLAQSYAIGLSGVRESEDTDNAKFYSEQAAASASNTQGYLDTVQEDAESAAASAVAAKSSEDNAKASENAAATSESNANAASESARTQADNSEASATAAKNSEDNAKASETAAVASALAADTSDAESSASAMLSESFAKGGTGTRAGEDTDNAKYYCDRAAEIVGTDSYVLKSSIGAANGVAGLDENGFVPASQLPAFVDDVIEGQYINSTEFVDTSGSVIVPESGKVYVDVTTGNVTSGKTYRWSGTMYVVIGSDLAIGETSSTAFRGDYGKAAYTHSQITSGNPHGVSAADVGLGNVPNVSTNNQTVTYTAATAIAALASGETMTVAMGKIARAVLSLISHLSDAVSHITAAERTGWNLKDAYTPCATAAATAAKTASLAGFTLKTGAHVAVRFSYANTVASPTLNINSTGAKAIVQYGTTAAASGQWAAGDVIDFIYDGARWAICGLPSSQMAKITANSTAISNAMTVTTASISGLYLSKINNVVYAKTGGWVYYTPSMVIPAGFRPSSVCRIPCTFMTAGWIALVGILTIKIDGTVAIETWNSVGTYVAAVTSMESAQLCINASWSTV